MVKSNNLFWTLIQVSEIYRNQFAYTRFLHRNSVNHIHAAHRHLVVRYNDKLAVFTKLTNHISELSYVGIVQRSINLIEYTNKTLETKYCDSMNSPKADSSGVGKAAP